MRQKKLAVLVLVATLTGLSACSSHQLRWTGATLARGTLDSLIGFPAVSVVAGAGEVLDAGETREHEREVRELANAWDEFTAERRGPGLPPADGRSVVIDVPGRFNPAAN
jgi:hypothetical protein